MKVTSSIDAKGKGTPTIKPPHIGPRPRTMSAGNLAGGRKRK